MRDLQKLIRNKMEEELEISSKYIYNTISEDGNPQYDIKPKNIFDFLTTGSKFKKIPEYQRPYSWQQNHVEDFLNDILDVSVKRNSKESWFLGSIYVTKNGASDENSFVLDGQQRLTTLQIVINELKLCRYYDSSYEFGGEFKKISKTLEECLLVNNGKGKYLPRFVTDKITNEFLDLYINDSSSIDSYDDYKVFKDKLISSENNGSNRSLSIKTLFENIKLVNKFIVQKLFNNIDSNNNPIFELDTAEQRVILFIKALLYKIWLIEIPLIKESVSIEIFESLNNRGKPLSLIDKIQFKSLSRGFSSVNKLDIKTHWGQVYELIDKHTRNSKNRFFKDEEDFIQSYFLGILGQEISGDNEYLANFESLYLNSEDKLFQFFSSIKRMLRFFNGINNFEESVFINNFSNNREREKVKAILTVLQILLKGYKNTLYLVINLIHHYNDEDIKNNYSLIQGIWSILRISYYKNLFEGEPSNIVRSDFNLLIRDYANKKPVIYSNLIFHLYDLSKTEKNRDSSVSSSDSNEFDSENVSNLFKFKNLKFDNNGKNLKYVFSKSLDSTSSLLNSEDNIKSKLILYLYCLLTNYSSINAYSKDQHDGMNVEHIFPRAWKNHWSDKKYKKEEVLNYLRNINEPLFLNSVSNSSIEFELKDYNTTPFIQEECLIEWIGNKLILNGIRNKRIKNESYKYKFSEGYNEAGAIVLPRIKSEKLMLNDSEFDFRTILDRSIHILDTINERFFTDNWDLISFD